MKRFCITTLFFIFTAAAIAQNADDACLYSQVYYQGTAKATGMGNAMGAVGGDMTAVTINPAGLGVYRGSELTTSFCLGDNYGKSTYYGNTTGANSLRFSIPNIGFVGTKQRSNYRPLRYTQFGISLTRTNDFNMHSLARGINPTSSKIDNYLAQIDGCATNELQEKFPYDIFPAWSTYLIDLGHDEIGDYYTSPVPQGNIWQGEENRFNGRAEEWSFTGSANYFDKLFVGMSLNLDHSKRFGTKVFSESRVEGSETDFNQWKCEETLRSTSWGGNAKIGLIYHALPWLRIGAAFHSPTICNFDETWQTETESEISSVTRKYISPNSHYNYTFYKPLKWVGSFAFVIGQTGIVSLDAEYTNFGWAHFKANDWDYTNVNNDIKATFGRTLNFRIGSEWSLGDTYLRVGAAYYGSPFGIGNASGSIKKASLGVHLPISDIFSFDFAYEFTYGRTYYRLYDAGELGIGNLTQNQYRNNLTATFKMRF